MRALRIAILTLVIMISGVTARAIPAYGQRPSPSRHTRSVDQPESSVWGELAPLPFDDQAVNGEGLADALNRSIDLARKGSAGEERVWWIRRTNLTLDRSGQIVRRMVAEGDVSLTLVEETRPGRWIEQVVWERYAFGSSQGPADVPIPEEIEAARGVGFEYGASDFDPVNISGDFGRLGTGIEAMMLKVLSMDVSTWHPIVTRLRDTFDDAPTIGARLSAAGWEEATEMVAPDEKHSAGSYRLGEMWSVVGGLTRFQGEPAALILFSAEGNGVEQRVLADASAVTIAGIEYFRGMMTVSLVDGRGLAGTLWGPLNATFQISAGDSAPVELPLSGVLQEVTFREIKRPHD